MKVRVMAGLGSWRGQSMQPPQGSVKVVTVYLCVQLERCHVTYCQDKEVVEMCVSVKHEYVAVYFKLELK